MLQSILLAMDHGSCSPIPLGTRLLSLLNCSLKDARRDWQWGSPLFNSPKLGAVGNLCARHSHPGLYVQNFWSCGMSALNSLLSF